MATRRNDLGPADRAVYDLVSRGGVDASHAALYRRQLGALARAGLVARNADGSYAAVPSQPVTLMPPAPPAAPAAPPMVTLVCRVPAEVVASLDATAAASGRTRSDAARDALARGLGSGLRKAVAR